jgi:hypothetical protein
MNPVTETLPVIDAELDQVSGGNDLSSILSGFLHGPAYRGTDPLLYGLGSFGGNLIDSFLGNDRSYSESAFFDPRGYSYGSRGYDFDPFGGYRYGSRGGFNALDLIGGIFG